MIREFFLENISGIYVVNDKYFPDSTLEKAVWINYKSVTEYRRKSDSIYNFLYNTIHIMRAVEFKIW